MCRRTTTVVLCLILLALYVPAKAQDFRPGFIVKTNGDSLTGFVAYKNAKHSSTHCVFKSEPRAETAQYNSSELKAYGFYDDKRFKSLTLPPNSDSIQHAFGHVIVEGPMSLYKVSNFYVVTLDDGVYVLPSPKGKVVNNTSGHYYQNDKQYVGLLSMLTRSCNQTAEETGYTMTDLSNYVRLFNRCKGFEETMVYKKQIVRVNFSVAGAYITSNASTDFLEKLDFDRSATVSGGIGIDLSFPRFFDRAFLTAEVWYVDFLHQTYLERLNAGEALYRDVILKGSYQKIPIGIRYNLYGRSTPYVKLGVAFGVVNDCSFREVGEREVNGVVYNWDEYNDQYLYRSPRFFWGAVGYDKIIIGKMRGFLECRFETGNGVVGTKIQNFSTLNNLNLIAGLRF